MNHELEKDIEKSRELDKIEKQLKLNKAQKDLQCEKIYQKCVYEIGKNKNKKYPERWLYVLDVSNIHHKINADYFYSIEGDKILNNYLKEKGLAIKFKSDRNFFEPNKELLYVLDYSVNMCIIL